MPAPPSALPRRRSALLLALAATAVPAQAQQTPASAPDARSPAAAVIEGVAYGADDRTPAAFALVRLLRADASPGGAAVAQVATGAGGRFRFAAVPAGAYRLQLARIGYRPLVSDPLRAAPGDTLRHTLRGSAQPVQLAEVLVRGAPACLTGDRLTEEPALAAVWQQARDGVELRRAFERQYRFVRVFRQDKTIRWRLRGARAAVQVDTVVSTPDSVEARDRRYQAAERARGYRRSNLISAPDEKQLVDPDFLRDHCLDAQLARADGLVGVRFRPVAPARDRDEVRGTLWLDAARYLARYLDVEWVRDDARSAAGRLDYTDVPVPGGVVRLPTGGRLKLDRIYGAAAGALLTGAEATLTYTYRDFAAAPASAPR